MANKADRFYFENLTAAAECACRAAEHLLFCLTGYKQEKLREMLEKMHELEHAGDTKKHEMTEALARAFVTPIEREDLATISQNIDEVTDGIEEVLQGFYMYQLSSVTPEAIAFANKLVESCSLMRDTLGELENFKKPEKLHKLVVEVNRVEEECDDMYIEATVLLPTRFSAPLDIISWREIYDRMENCADACEHVGDCVEMVVMKNN